jgi:hypothetical protein
VQFEFAEHVWTIGERANGSLWNPAFDEPRRTWR